MKKNVLSSTAGLVANTIDVLGAFVFVCVLPLAGLGVLAMFIHDDLKNARSDESFIEL